MRCCTSHAGPEDFVTAGPVASMSLLGLVDPPCMGLQFCCWFLGCCTHQADPEDYIAAEHAASMRPVALADPPCIGSQFLSLVYWVLFLAGRPIGLHCCWARFLDVPSCACGASVHRFTFFIVGVWGAVPLMQAHTTLLMLGPLLPYAQL